MTTAADGPPDAPLLRTPLFESHVALGARMVPFAGYEMPVQYKPGVMAEHLHARAEAGLFDVSHMGQVFLVAEDGRHETVAAFLETLVPADILGLGRGRQRYTQFLNDAGGILDDLMVSRSPDPAADGSLFLVINAACKDADIAHLTAHLAPGIRLERADDRGLIALQGPAAAAVLARHVPGCDAMDFMAAGPATFDGRIGLTISRSGYTGEDGYELSVPAESLVAVWQALLSDSRVLPIGLGARDSLRLEAGLCLYGHDIDTATSPVEAGLSWSIQKRRREEGGFPGYLRLRNEWKEGPARRRVGLKPEGKAPAREGCEVVAGGRIVGSVTSGGFGPSVGGPVAMGYVERAFAEPGTAVELMVRGKPLAASVVTLPFVPARFYRAPR